MPDQHKYQSKWIFVSYKMCRKGIELLMLSFIYLNVLIHVSGFLKSSLTTILCWSGNFTSISPNFTSITSFHLHWDNALIKFSNKNVSIVYSNLPLLKMKSNTTNESISTPLNITTKEVFSTYLNYKTKESISIMFMGVDYPGKY